MASGDAGCANVVPGNVFGSEILAYWIQRADGRAGGDAKKGLGYSPGN